MKKLLMGTALLFAANSILVGCAIRQPEQSSGLEQPGEDRENAGSQSDDTHEEPSTSSAAYPDDQELFTDTSVHTNPDGTTIVRTRLVTRAEQIRERDYAAEVRAAKARGVDVQQMYTLPVDPFCASTSLELRDQTNGLGNRICFSGSLDSADLSLYTRTTACGGTIQVKWYGYSYSGCTASLSQANRVKSLNAGNTAGGFGTSSQGWCSLNDTNWSAWQYIASLTPKTGERWVSRNSGPFQCT